MKSVSAYYSFDVTRTAGQEISIEKKKLKILLIEIQNVFHYLNYLNKKVLALIYFYWNNDWQF